MALPHSRASRTLIFSGVGLLILLAAILIAARLYLNSWLLDYVNRVLNDIEGYQGSVERIEVELYRGAYRIHELKLYKKAGDIRTPFLDIDTVDLSIQWGALFQGRIVSDAELIRPVINFAVSPSGTVEQTGAEVDWTVPIKDLMPIDINLVTIEDGKITYQDFSTNPQVNIYMHQVTGEVRNLRNVVDEDKDLPSTLFLKGNSIGNGIMEISGRMNILRPVPDVDIDAKLENVHLPALSDYSDAYAAIDIRQGELDVYSEVVIKDGRVSGYIKPIATHMSLIDLSKRPNPINLAWQTLVSIIAEVFHNQPRDQFATKIPLEGDLNNIRTDVWSALAGIVRNAFISGFNKGLEEDIEFESAP